ncbi:MAG: YihA family ribosome biogenesis GTP-binding protein [Ignavibacteria bacterium]|nr:YihA family ribosome biogenesis GTP-binding protein [Bacteroidota bacterium]MSQ46682.1 YihA family ribosome biogenesis GTP-binding protein [Ignavibacteria bacterium]
MKISTIDFIIGVANLKQLPKDNLPEVVFLGRSNVGKSSLLNKVCNRKNIARVSKNPGKTRELNYYMINKKVYFVDLPGYGYARVAEHVKAGWATLIEDFFRTRKQIAVALQIVDARLGPTELDNTMLGWLDYYEVPFILMMTKADKLPVSKLKMQVERITQQLSGFTQLVKVIPFSSVTGVGRAELLSTIDEFTDKKVTSTNKQVIALA